MPGEYESQFSLDSFELYNRARAFRKDIYRLIRDLPAIERYCLAPQMRRAAISVSNNVAEGHGRWHFQENVQYCRTTRGSIEELIDDLNMCLDEAYFDEALIHKLKDQAQTLIARVNSYITYLRKRRSAGEGS